MSGVNVNHLSILKEQVIDHNKAVLEAVGDIQAKVANLPTRDKLNELKQDMKIAKAAVTDLSRQSQCHERCISQREAA
jgi:hypothetical protein